MLVEQLTCTLTIIFKSYFSLRIIFLVIYLVHAFSGLVSLVYIRSLNLSERILYLIRLPQLQGEIILKRRLDC